MPLSIAFCVAGAAAATCRIHTEPVSDILFTEEAIFTACCSGAIKCWLRPHVAEEMAAQLQQQGAAPG